MGKEFLEAIAKAQFASIQQSPKDRLRYCIAGVKDGKFYDLAGTIDYGVYDADAPDAEFITEADANVSRVTKVKIDTVTKRMEDYFNEHGINGEHDVFDADSESATTDDSGAEVEQEDNTNEGVTTNDTCSSANTCSSDDDGESDKINAIEKALTKGKVKKATKLINELEDGKVKKKMLKKLKKLNKEVK